MRDIEEKILKSLDEDIKILKRANFKTDEIIDHIKNFRDYSNDNTEEYKKEIDKLMEGKKKKKKKLQSITKTHAKMNMLLGEY